MGVSLDMFIRETAVLVTASKDIPENVVSPTGALSTAGFLSERDRVDWTDWMESALAAGEAPWRRALKHEVQYTGFPWVGWKGRVADILQLSQTVWYAVRLGVRLDGRRAGQVNMQEPYRNGLPNLE